MELETILIGAVIAVASIILIIIIIGGIKACKKSKKEINNGNAEVKAESTQVEVKEEK